MFLTVSSGYLIRSFPQIHSLDGSVGFTLEWNGLKFVYGGDSYPAKTFVEAAQGADFVIHEVMMSAEDWITKWSYDPVSYFGLNFEQSIDPSNPLLEANLKGNELAVSSPFKLRMTVDHAFFFPKKQVTLVPWVTAYWEDDSYLTIWNVDKHTDDMEFVILDQDIKYTDDRREAWSMVHAGLRVYSGEWMAELFGYNLTDEVVQYWGGAAEQVAKGSFSVPRTYGFRVGYTF